MIDRNSNHLSADVLPHHRNVIKQNQYLPCLTALRGIAALWVVLFHLDVIIFYRELGSLIPHEMTGLITQGYLWVDFFFMLSGFIMCHIYGEKLGVHVQSNAVKKYLIARFFRIYPLHLFTLLLLIGFVFLVSTLTPSALDDSWAVYFDWQALLSNVFLTNAMNQHTYLSWNIVSWSIGAEWWAYIFGIGLFLYLGGHKVGRPVIVAVVSFFCLILLVYFHTNNNLDIKFDFGFLRCIFGFSLGVSSYTVFKQNIARNILQQDRYFILTVFTLLVLFHLKVNDLFTIPLFVILILCAAFNQGTVGKLLSARVPQFLGEISYSIYLMHGVWFMVFWFELPVLSKLWSIEVFSLTHTIMYVFIFLVLTIASAMVSYRYVEVPCRYLLKVKNKEKIVKRSFYD
jgi:peptidoglycan/LPS O-acetylase OafA/YrhL